MPLEYYFMLAGLVLLLIEFVVPGFGIFGVSGMVCLTVGGFYVLGGNVWAALVCAVSVQKYLDRCRRRAEKRK